MREALTHERLFSAGLDWQGDIWTDWSAGSYVGAGNRALSFSGRPMHLASLAGAASTIIDLQAADRAFSFVTETPYTTVTGARNLLQQQGVVILKEAFLAHHRRAGPIHCFDK